MTKNFYFLSFALTLFLSAFLLFSLQPLVGKLLLPLVGGSPQGWLVALVFFQAALLLGYYAAHVLSRLSAQKHLMIYIVCLGLSFIFLPISLLRHQDLIEGIPTAFDVLAILTVTTAFPFATLAMTSPTLQRFFSSYHEQSPYILYAVSNAGSFIGLLSYPFIIEMMLPLSRQSQGWMMGMMIVMALALLILMQSRQKMPLRLSIQEDQNIQKPSLNDRILWVLYAAIPSGLLVGISATLMVQVVSMPLMWALPLAVYLVTLIMAFGEGAFSKKIDQSLFIYMPFIASAGVFLSSYGVDLRLGTMMKLGLHLMVFFAACLICHAMLAYIKPHKKYLTSYYLWQSLGSVLGSAFCVFIAPHLFKTPLEYPLLLLAAVTLSPYFKAKFTGFYSTAALLGLGLMFLYIGIFYFDKTAIALMMTVLFLAALLIGVHPKSALAMSFVLLLMWTHNLEKRAIDISRNFFGSIRVMSQEFKLSPEQPSVSIRALTHGSTLHGFSTGDAALDRTPMSYYHHQGPLGEIMRAVAPKAVGVIGLGTGNIACYGGENRSYTFIEIDADIEKVARKYFPFLDLCPKNPPEIIIGDGRIEMAKMADASFDVVIVDAFTSDAIPTHLMTVEAMKIFLDKTTADGVIAYHISNNFFDLAPILAANAAHLGLHTIARQEMRPKDAFASPSTWALIYRKAPAGLDWPVVTAKPEMMWTDDYTPFLKALSILQN